ncbi:BtrH N-terminal domain-containing protein [Hydrogenimonas thermophila]|uniref:BtrH N-terminal domain-containing protein n=1 Tax=Hydrogenimonas thermophila TaxID=223786 RepID=UPI00293732D5|nr:BtrH N-terminal domain-containing protein [Hydrogenimonas thermophila]WOE69600.1 BtrH N-terminal domain-containing protein [Hydrogenimonas thermophila]WOE72114.1 BtrH N-terminal domain-containing protein [Hydrogenimonas thermophila]
MTATTFDHSYSAHCESGVMSSLLRHHGINLSEPMVFGLSNALTFAYLPFVKMGGMPLIAYRSIPRSIIKTLCKNLNVKMKMETFSNREKGTKRLDELLDQGKVVGCQTSVFWLPYFPEDMRFHFNAHNLIVYGKDENEYLISDPVFENVVRCECSALTKARFVKGVMAPKGLLYYITETPEEIDYKAIIQKSIKKTAKMMLKTPVPIAGLKGIRLLSKSILKLEQKDEEYARLFLGHIVRMQEEIGTGGAGFRFIYASFLQEASELFDNDQTLQEASQMMLETGDNWRNFALLIAKSIRSKKEIDYRRIAEKLLEVADMESKVYLKMLEFNGQ